MKKAFIKDYYYKEQLPYWEDEVTEIIMEILSDRDKEIISMIDEMIEKENSGDYYADTSEGLFQKKGRILALTELKEKL